MLFTTRGVNGVSAELISACLHILQLLAELQQISYCHWERNFAGFLRVHVCTWLLAEAAQRVDPERLRNVYWANLVIALPLFCELLNVPLYLLLEEKFEQSFFGREAPFCRQKWAA